MYNDFFKLKSSPFELSPDPSFLFASEKSKDALASISYAVSRRKGFVVMTGEVGTGKTLILRCLFELWERERVPFAYFIGPRLSTMDFLKYIAFELGIEVAEPTKGNLLRALYGFLLAQFENDLTTVLVIDEAHQISQSVLEEIRLLANFETAQQKLLQIVLAGQPELDKKLDSMELRSLKQRIAVRCSLEPLGAEEVRNYIDRRLARAGAESQTIFPAETIDAIHRYSTGIPRLINSVCDQALIAACTRGIHVVPVEIIEEVAVRFRLAPEPGVTQIDEPLPLAGPIAIPREERALENSANTTVHTPVAGPGVLINVPLNPTESEPKLELETTMRPRLVGSGPASEIGLPSTALPVEDTAPHEVVTAFGGSSHEAEERVVALQRGSPNARGAVSSAATAPEQRAAPVISRLPVSAWDRVQAARLHSVPEKHLPVSEPKTRPENPTSFSGTVFQSNYVERDSWQVRFFEGLSPAVRLSLVACAAAILTVMLAMAIIFAR